jgi:hypothetical protein
MMETVRFFLLLEDMFECSDYERRRETVMNGQMVEEVVYEGGETVMGGFGRCNLVQASSTSA